MDRQESVLTAMCGTVPDWDVYSPTVHGVQRVLNTLGITRFSARELCTPAYPQYLSADESVIPPRNLAVNYFTNIAVVNFVRLIIGEPFRVKHAFRPSKYNASCKGTIRSDHITASALDVDILENFHDLTFKLLDSIRKSSKIEISLGRGTRVHSDGTMRLHIGTFKGNRTWDY